MRCSSCVLRVSGRETESRGWSHSHRSCAQGVASSEFPLLEAMLEGRKNSKLGRSYFEDCILIIADWLLTSSRDYRGCACDVTTRKWAWCVEGKKGVCLWENSTGYWFGACFQMIDKQKIIHAAVCQANFYDQGSNLGPLILKTVTTHDLS